MKTRRLAADAAGIETAVAALRTGRLVAFPTETVYGLGALATDTAAIARVFEAKGRPAHNPLILHVAGLAEAAALAVLDGRAERLAEAFWPGPLTLVLPLRSTSGIAAAATAGLDTVAVRVPRHPTARALLAAVSGPVAAPSANRSGRISPTTADHVLADLDGRIDLVLDAGPVEVGIESTVLDLSRRDAAQILRPGGITRDAIEAVIGRLPEAEAPVAEPLRSPGLLARHYAPRTPMRLDAITVEADEALLAFGPEPLPGAAAVLNLSPAADLEEAAHNLYAMLRALDAKGARRIAVMRLPGAGLGEALADRLRRAATP
jgi:L-threonylcarbamoyladenylate synthase